MWSLFLSPWTWLAILVGYYLWRRMMQPFAYFANRGVVFKKPWPIFGNFGRMVLKQESMFALAVNSYNEFQQYGFYGMFDFTRPLFAIRDPQLIRQITTTDFEQFLDHRPLLPEGVLEPFLAQNMFMLCGQKWRNMRHTLSPAFTGSKMRQMFQLVVECSQQSAAHLLAEANASRGPFVTELRDLFTRYTNDVIATSAFGIAVNSYVNRDNEFYLMGKTILNFTGLTALRVIVMSAMPRVSQLLGVKLFGDKPRHFYHSLVHDTIAYREREGIHRPDMINLLMEARKGQLTADDPSRSPQRDDATGFATVEEVRAEALQGEQKLRWSDDDLTAQCFLFFVASYDNVSILLCFAAHELMENPAVQQRLIVEVDEAREQLAGQPVTYDVLLKLRYLDQVVSETLRKWPPVQFMDRECQSEYVLSDSAGQSVRLQKGDAVWIPTIAIHRDPKFYADPERFDPERFSDERRGEIHSFTFIPFGSGPRNCIGSRLALIECKTFLFELLTHFTFERAATSTIPLQMAASMFTVQVKNGFNVHLKPRCRGREG